MLTCKNCNALFKPKPGQAAVASGLVLCPACEARFAGEEPVAASAQPPRRAGTISSASRAAPEAAGRASGVRGRASGANLRKERVVAPPKEALNPEAKIGLKIAIPLLLIAAIFIVYAVNKSNERERDELAYDQKVTRFISDLRAMDLNDPDKAAQALVRINSEQDAWRDAKTESEVRQLIAKADFTVKRGNEQKETNDALTDVEAKIQNASTLKAEDLAEAKVKINRLEFEVQALGKPAIERFNAAKKAIGKLYAEALYKDARAMGTTGASGIAAMQKYKKAEDEVQLVYTNAKLVDDQPGAQEMLEIWKRIIADSNDCAAQAYDAAAIKAVAPRDLLANAEIVNWLASEVEGFSHAIKGGTLTIVGPDKTAKKRALMSIGDQEKWRDFVVEMVVQRSEGSVTFCARLGKDYDANTPQITLDQEALPTDQNVRATITCIGGKMQFQIEGNVNPVEIPLENSYSRKGSFGILIPSGSRIKFTSLTARVLR